MRRLTGSSLLVALLITLTLAARTSSAEVADRVAGAGTTGGRVTLTNSVHPKARLAVDMGAAAGDTRLESMSLRFSKTAAQEAALDQLLTDQQNPASGRYHLWLTPAQYGAQFGLSAADIAKVTAWLTSQGFAVTGVAKSGTFVTFSGTVAQAQAAFATSIRRVSLAGEAHLANVSDASLPAGIASVVLGVTGLDDFRIDSRVQTSTAKEPLHADFTSSISGSHYIAPGDFYTIYDVNPLLTSAVNGSGVTIAIMGQTDILLTDIAAFRTAAGLTPNVPTVQVYGCDPGIYTAPNKACGAPSSSDLSEASLDVEWAGAAAPSANIIFVNSYDVLLGSLTGAIDNNIAPIITVSYGNCESAFGSETTTLNALFKQANAQGITVVGPSGDSGATDCDATAPATHGLAVDFPASSPYVTGLGGTMYNEGAGTYWNASNGNYSGSAVSYIPEAVWNESAATGTLATGGGGASILYSKPSWQVGTGVPNDGVRDVPDMALDAAVAHDGTLFCAAGSCVNGTFRASDGQTLTRGGGTSFATPEFAGLLALVEQKNGQRMGNVNPTIYALANSTYYNLIFHDVSTGNNNSTCTAGTANCPVGGSIGYSAGVGYDQATGWGSLDAFYLANDWSLAKITPGDFTLTPSAATVTVASGGTTSAVTFTVTPTGGFTGSVVFSALLPANLAGTASFSVNPVIISSTNAGTTALTISAIKGSWVTMPENPANRSPWYLAGSGTAVAGLLLLAAPRRRRLGALTAVVLAGALAGGLSGCGGTANTTVATTTTTTTPTTPTTSGGPYTVTVAGTYTNAATGAVTQHYSTLTVTVQ